MGKTRTTIELNGKKYDAVSGKLLEITNQIGPKAKPLAKERRTMDGVLHAGKKLVGQGKSRLALPQRHRDAALPRKRTPEKSKTLMRNSVKPPLNKAKKDATEQTTSFRKASSHIFDIARAVNGERLSRAKEVKKSSVISRFDAGAGQIKKAAAMSRAAVASTAQSTAAVLQAAPLTSHVKDRFDHALERANSHEQKKLSKPALSKRTAARLGMTSRGLFVSLAVVFAFLGGGYLVYHNLPNIALRFAATRAGFKATLPQYMPSGFSLKGPIHYSNGKIQIDYHSNSDTRAYSVTQQPSQWNSDSLLNNYVTKDRQPYQTFQDSGKTIYIYNGGSATWVDGGIWYKVEAATDSLNSDALLKIANSL